MVFHLDLSLRHSSVIVDVTPSRTKLDNSTSVAFSPSLVALSSTSIKLSIMCAHSHRSVRDSSGDKSFCRQDASVRPFCQARIVNKVDGRDGSASFSLRLQPHSHSVALPLMEIEYVAWFFYFWTLEDLLQLQYDRFRLNFVNARYEAMQNSVSMA